MVNVPEVKSEIQFAENITKDVIIYIASMMTMGFLNIFVSNLVRLH